MNPDTDPIGTKYYVVCKKHDTLIGWAEIMMRGWPWKRHRSLVHRSFDNGLGGSYQWEVNWHRNHDNCREQFVLEPVDDIFYGRVAGK